MVVGVIRGILNNCIKSLYHQFELGRQFQQPWVLGLRWPSVTGRVWLEDLEVLVVLVLEDLAVLLAAFQVEPEALGAT